MKSHSYKNGSEPIPGYRLRKRIGAGGYGEVWLADAPGGLQKAIKFIFGSVNESQATSELKSLKRIKEVTHPFLLSLERIEVVDNQVLIITELAESSLLDRFDLYRRRGEPGIPRSMLLELLRDTADGLDFLSEKHSLQHLDVKPGNLLIIADRVKVADFGLVKDLKEQSQSLVSGLTPTYSAPEIFDGRPDSRSDQYSLAIVYMEMLTGQLPFSGKTTAEIARQHLSMQPDLEALPPADRPIVLRALSKNPLDRYSTCRAFVEQLQKVRAGVVPLQLASSEEPLNENSSPVQTSPLSSSATATQHIKQEFLPAIDQSEAVRRYTTPHSLFIGLGGTGCDSLQHLRKMMLCNCDARLTVDEHAWLALDTDPKAIEEAIGTDKETLGPSQAIQIPIFKPIDYRDATPSLLEPISRRWLYNIPKSQRTEGVRPIAILAMLDHYEALKSRIASELKELIERHESDSDCEEPLRVYLLASLHGGTGSALLCEIAAMVRRIFNEQNYRNYRICGIGSLATTLNSGPANMAAAAALASLSELHYQMNRENSFEPIFYMDRGNGNDTRPFDWFTMVDGGLHGSDDAPRATQSLAETALLDSQTALSAALAEQRIESSNRRDGWMRVCSTAPVALIGNIDREHMTTLCLKCAVENVLSYMSGGGDPTLTPEETASPTASGDIPLTPQASEEFTNRLLQDLGVYQQSKKIEDFAHSQEGNKVLSSWARRLSSNESLVHQQLAADLKTWKSSIATIVHMRMYNWKQVERIQLNVIEGILDFCENSTEHLVALFRPFSSMLGDSNTMRSAAVAYLKHFAKECLALLSHFQKDGSELRRKVGIWAQSLEASAQAKAQKEELDLSQLPSEFKSLADRVSTTLEKTIHAEALDILDDAIDKVQSPESQVRPLVPDDLQLPYLMSLANDVVEKISSELNIDFESVRETTSATQTRTIQAKSLGEFGLGGNSVGTRVFRFTISPIEQRSSVINLLRKQDLLHTTCVLNSTSSLGSYVVCEGEQHQLSRAITNALRPSPQTIQLADRLRTRVDIQWDPIDALFDLAEPENEALAAQTAFDLNPDPRNGSVSVPNQAPQHQDRASPAIAPAVNPSPQQVAPVSNPTQG